MTKRFDRTVAVDDVTLAIERGEMLALLGPSGSGRTTMLRLLAGFETPDAGRVMVEGEDVTRVEPSGAGSGTAFRHYALFPHLDVGENVGFGILGSRSACEAGVLDRNTGAQIGKSSDGRCLVSKSTSRA